MLGWKRSEHSGPGRTAMRARRLGSMRRRPHEDGQSVPGQRAFGKNAREKTQCLQHVEVVGQMSQPGVPPCGVRITFRAAFAHRDNYGFRGRISQEHAPARKQIMAGAARVIAPALVAPRVCSQPCVPGRWNLGEGDNRGIAQVPVTQLDEGCSPRLRLRVPDTHRTAGSQDGLCSIVRGLVQGYPEGAVRARDAIGLKLLREGCCHESGLKGLFGTSRRCRRSLPV